MDKKCPQCHSSKDIITKPITHDCMECGHTWNAPTLTDAEIEAKLKEPNFYIVNAMKNLSKDELRWVSLKMLQWSGLTSKEIENMAEREYPFNHIDRDDSQYVTDRINTQRASYIAGIKEIIKILNK